MKLAIVLLAIVGVAMACDTRKTREEFEAFRRQYRKVYKDQAEEDYRCTVFADNYAKVENHNLRQARGLETFTRAINQFSDYTNEEFISYYTGFKPEFDDAKRAMSPYRKFRDYDPNFKAPVAVDWVASGHSTPIKNQGKCGSCWAFATAAVMESLKLIKDKTPFSWYDLSEQHLIECSHEHGNQKCQGGLMRNAYEYFLQKNHGAQLEDHYPYISHDGDNGTDCQYIHSRSPFGITGYTELARDDNALEQAVALGPVAVGVNAGDWQDVGTGIYCPTKLLGAMSACPMLGLNHAVVVVGYTKDYWIIKNSWGTSWGDGGYMKLCRKFTNNCGINMMASYPHPE